MDVINFLTTTGVLITALGGIEGIKWWRNRRANARQENAAAEDAEKSNQRKHVDWLEQRLATRDAKVDALYSEVKKLEHEKLQLTEALGKSQLENMLMKIQKCEVRGCSSRQPPNDY